tara:strand:+ start:67 stop:1323 length:1257 start_codon:yes stop_codon:yes gene_type:complete
MSKTLRRPMFKMGGDTNSGIVSGFEREKFNKGTTFGDLTEEEFLAGLITPKSPEEELAELAASVRQGAAEPFTTPPAYTQPGFGLSEYLALAKLGANIASAPNRGGGFKGFAASTAPAFGQFAEDLDALNRQKMQNKAAFDAAAREAKLKAEGTAAQLTGEGIVEKMRQAGELEQIRETGKQERLTNEEKVFALDNAFNKLQEVEAQYFDNAAQIQALDPTQFADISTYEEELRKLKQKEQSLTMQIFFILEQDMPQDAELGDLTVAGILEKAKSQTLSALNLVEEPAPGDEKYAEFGQKYKEISEKLIKEARDLLTPATGFETPIPTFAEGGRVKAQQGQFMAPTQQGQSPRGTNILSYEELRARLPQEVSDEVVRLLATSEAALLEFAQIQTQEDIARFNKNYSADLQLPSQTQVV